MPKMAQRADCWHVMSKHDRQISKRLKRTPSERGQNHREVGPGHFPGKGTGAGEQRPNRGNETPYRQDKGEGN